MPGGGDQERCSSDWNLRSQPPTTTDGMITSKLSQDHCVSLTLQSQSADLVLMFQVNMMVTDTSAHHLLNRENIESEGKFAFTTDKDDIFEICFISRVPSNVRGSRHTVALDMKMGVEAKNYEQLGDAAKLKPLEVDLKRLEDLSESIVQDFAFMRRREVVEGRERSVELNIDISGGDERH